MRPDEVELVSYWRTTAMKEFARNDELKTHIAELEGKCNRLKEEHDRLNLAYYRLKQRMHAYSYGMPAPQFNKQILAKPMSTPPLDRDPIPQEIYRDYIAGVQFWDYKKAFQDNALHVGDVLKLVHEEYNPHDPNAVAVHTADMKYKLGFIKKIDTRLLHDFRTRKIKLTAYLHECDFTAKPWQMFAVRITAPSIVRTTSDPDLEF